MSGVGRAGLHVRLYSDLIAEMQGLEPELFHVIRPVTKILMILELIKTKPKK